MALSQCVIAMLVVAGVAVQPEAPVRRHRAQATGDDDACTTDEKFTGAATWKGRCYTLDKCRSDCRSDSTCVGFNWWPKKGGCRHHSAFGSKEKTTGWSTIGGGPNCKLDVMGPTDCGTCSPCETGAPTPAPAPPNEPATEWCGKGIRNPLSEPNKCCAATCKNAAGEQECGGSQCGSRVGGAKQCCHSKIEAFCETKDSTGCIIPASCKSESQYSTYSNGDWVNQFNTAVSRASTTGDGYYAWCNLYGCPQFNSQASKWCEGGGKNACRNQCEALPGGPHPNSGRNGVCTRYGAPKCSAPPGSALAECGDYVIVDRFDGSFWGQRSAMGYVYYQRNAANLNELLTWSASNNVDWGWKEGSNYGQLFYKQGNGGTTPSFAASLDAWTADRVNCSAADACQGGGRCSFVKKSVLMSHASWANTKARAAVAAR